MCWIYFVWLCFIPLPPYVYLINNSCYHTMIIICHELKTFYQESLGVLSLKFGENQTLTFSFWLILGRRYQVSEANSFDSLAYLSVFYTYHNLDCRQMSWSNPNALFLLETSLETSSISRWSMPSTCFSICFLKVASQEALMAKKALVRMYA